MKMLKTKHFRRLAVFLAMIAPAVYLFGSQFSALTGSHGEQVFAEPVYVSDYVEVSSFSSFVGKIVVEPDDFVSFCDYVLSLNSAPRFSGDYSVNGMSCFSWTFGSWTSSSKSSLFRSSDYGYVLLVSANYDTGVVEYGDFSTTGLSFVGDGYFLNFVQSLGFSDYRYYVLTDVPTDVVVENNSSYTDYIFGNFFMKDNFLVKWGRNALSENPFGFAPFGAFWRYLDVNVLHLSNDQMGLMGYGYVYYCCHVLLFDIGFILVTFFLDFIQKIADKFTGGE